jgi:hypothetical protein
MTTKNQFLEVDVSPFLEEADRRAQLMGHLNSYTVRGVAGAQAGKLGELVAYDYLTRCGVEYEEVDCTEYDAIFWNNNLKYTLEIKTKERTVAPREDYECSVFQYTEGHQKPDFYFFVSLLSTKKNSEDINRFTKAYILGSISGIRFDEQSRRLGTGYVDFSNNWSPSKDTRNIFIQDLAPPKLSVC